VTPKQYHSTVGNATAQKEIGQNRVKTSDFPIFRFLPFCPIYATIPWNPLIPMASNREMVNRIAEIQEQLKAGVPIKRIAPQVIEKYELKRSAAYNLIRQAEETL
jgi:hypothetical protein